MLHYLIFSLWNLLANLISYSSMVMCFVCIAQRFVSLKGWITYAPVTSCNANTAPACMWWSPCSFCRISHTSCKNGTFVDFWNFLISQKAFVPSQNLVLLLGVLPVLVLIFSSHFTPICGVSPFTPLDVLPWIEVTKGKPIMACLWTVDLVPAIFSDEKYPGFTELVWLSFKFDLFFSSFHISI